MTSKRNPIVAFPGDLHCGHNVGLTPPQWQGRKDGIKDRTLKRLSKLQTRMWTHYETICDTLKPDVAVWMGDMMDGKGQRSGGTEQITTDPLVQAEMAFECVDRMAAKVNIFLRGTPYHTGQDTQFEDLFKLLGYGEVHDHRQINVAGVVFDCKHKVGSSSTPYGGMTPLMKAETWNALWSETDTVDRADMVVRGHIHRHLCGCRAVGSKLRWFMSTPALQAPGSRYGKQQCEAIVNWGVVAVEIFPDKTLRPIPMLYDLDKGRKPAIKIEVTR